VRFLKEGFTRKEYVGIHIWKKNLRGQHSKGRPKRRGQAIAASLESPKIVEGKGV